MRNTLNTVLFLAIWAATGTLIFWGIQLATPTLNDWLGLLSYGRVDEFWGAVRFMTWMFGFVAVHSAPVAAPLAIGPVILNLMQRHPALRITHRQPH